MQRCTIVKTIQTSRTDFDVSVQALVRLKNAGASEQVINAMLSSASGRNRPAIEKATDKKRQRNERQHQQSSSKLCNMNPALQNYRMT